MYVRNLYIRNFRNFAETDVEFGPDVSAIVGANAVGKSNVIAALRLLFDPALPRQSRLLDEHDFHDPGSLEAGKEIVVSATIVDFEENEAERVYCAQWKVDDNRAVVTYRFRPNEEARLAAAERRALIQQARAQRAEGNDEIDIPQNYIFNIDEYDYQRVGGIALKSGGAADVRQVDLFDDFGKDAERRLNQFAYFELGAIRDVVRDLSARRTSPLHRLLELVKVPPEVKARVEEAVSEANNKIREDEFFRDLEQVIDANYEDLAASVDPLNVHVGIADPSFSAAIRSISLLLTDASLTEAEMTRNSLGYNNLLYIAILLEFFRRRSADRGSTQMLVIEEPEAHLHVNAQRALVRRLRDKPHQTIITTHSLVATAAARFENISVVTAHNGASSAHRLASAMQASSAEIADLNRYFDMNRSAVLFSRRVVLVEGLSEELLIVALAQNRGMNLDKQNVSVVSIVGTHFDLFARLFSTNTLGNMCFVVTDGDAQNAEEWQNGHTPDTGERQNPLTLHDVPRFGCLTTLEMTLTQPANREWITFGLREIGAPIIAEKVDESLRRADDASLQLAQIDVVRTASRLGKGRFAQALATRIELMAHEPGYLSNLLDELQ